MAQKQSTEWRTNEEGDSHITSSIDEENGFPDLILISPLPSKARDDDDEASTDETGKKRRFMIFFLLTLLAVIVATVTAPLVYKSFKKKKPDKGADMDNGETPIRPTSEDTGALPNSQDTRAPGSTEDEDGHPSSTPSIDVNTSTDPQIVEESASASEFLPKLPFDDVNLPYFTEDVMGGYNNKTEFEEALAEAAKFLINKAALQNLGYSSPSLTDHLTTNTWRGSNEGEEPQGFYDVTDFETNNQEIGIDEADLMKADSNYMYAAYSNYVLVWDTKGNQVAQVKMPTSTDSEDTSSQSSVFGGGIFSGSAFGTFSGHKAHVESLLLVDDYLVIVVSGYGNSQSEKSGDPTVLVNYLGTQVRTYKTSTIATTGELTLVGSKDINGRFVDARSIGNQIHIATISGIDTHTYLTAPLDRYVNFSGLTDDEYVERVRSEALDKYIPTFVQKLSNELLYVDHTGNSVLPNLLQLNRWQSSGGEARTRQAHTMVDAGMFRTGLINSVTLITSLDVTAEPNVDRSRLSQELVTTTSAFLAPAQQSHLYSTASHLVLATRAWNWKSDVVASEEVTHLVVLKVNERDDNKDIATTSFESLGTVRGYLLNPHSLSIVNSKLRVATTISRRWRFQGLPELSSNAIDVGDHYSDKVIVTDRSVGQQDESVVEDSITENYITVFDLESGAVLKERGSVQLGEKDEIITAVRFFDEIAYCVTFEQTDPFYVVDLKKIAVLGFFKQNGFSNYLHPLNEDHTLLLGIGQNTSDEGVTTGFMITVFDVADPTNPQPLVSYTVDDSTEGSNGAAAQSTAQWDYKSFRYVDGKLIVPLNIVTYSTEGSTGDSIRQTLLGSFEGFVVFNVDAESITEHIRISHTTMGCHYCGYLAPRSFVYNGNVLTAEGNIVSSTNLYNTHEQWAFHVAVIGEEARCCY